MKIFWLAIGMIVCGFALSQGVNRGVVYPVAAIWFITVFFWSPKNKSKGTTWGSENRSELSKKIDER